MIKSILSIFIFIAISCKPEGELYVKGLTMPPSSGLNSSNIESELLHYEPLPFQNFSTAKVGVDGLLSSVTEDNDNIYFGGRFSYIGEDLGSVALFDTQTRQKISNFYIGGAPSGLLSDKNGGFIGWGRQRLINGVENIGFYKITSSENIDHSFFAGYEDLGGGNGVGDNSHGLTGYINNYEYIYYPKNLVPIDKNKNRFFTIENNEIKSRKLSDGAYDSLTFSLSTSCPGSSLNNLFISEETNRLFYFIGGEPSVFNLTTGALLHAGGDSNCSSGTREIAIANKSKTIFYVIGDSLKKLTFNSNLNSFVTELLLPLKTDPSTTYLPTAAELSHDGKLLYLIGNFSEIAGKERKNIASINLETNEVTLFNPSKSFLADDWIFDLALNPLDNCLYVVGNFSSIGGEERQNIACLNLKTGKAHSFSLNVGSLQRISVSDDGKKIILGGEKVLNNAKKRQDLAIYSKTSQEVHPFDAKLTRPYLQYAFINGGVKKVLLSHDGSKLFVGGGFEKVKGVYQKHFAAFDKTQNFLFLNEKGPFSDSPSFGEIKDMAIDQNDSTLYFLSAKYDPSIDNFNTQFESFVWNTENRTIIDTHHEAEPHNIKITSDDHFIAYNYRNYNDNSVKLVTYNTNAPSTLFTIDQGSISSKQTSFDFSSDNTHLYHLKEGVLSDTLEKIKIIDNSTTTSFNLSSSYIKTLYIDEVSEKLYFLKYESNRTVGFYNFNLQDSSYNFIDYLERNHDELFLEPNNGFFFTSHGGSKIYSH